jgi:hypothetical protein
MQLPTLKFKLGAPESFGNLAEKMDVSERRRLAGDLIELIGVDEQSMGEWLSEARGYLDTVTATGNDAKPQDREQEGSNEDQPPSTEMTLSAVIQFSARATDALLGEPDLAKASEPGGEALASWVSSQLRTKDPNWTLDTDPLVVHMSVTGLAWRKRRFNREDKVFHSYFRTCEDVIINANVRSIERAPRVTDQFERYPYEIDRSIERKHWVDYEPQYDEQDPQAPKKFYECDCWLDLDGDDIDEPWTVTISRDDFPEVVKIEPLWSKSTVIDTDEALYFNPIRCFYPYRFLPDPKGGFFPMGFGKLLARVENSADRLLASITDTAKSESENGGLVGGSQFGLPDKIEIKGNRLISIPTDGMPLDKMFSAFPMKSVSPGSVQVLEKIMTLGDRLAGTLNLLENAPASMTATMAHGIIDSGAQVQSAVHRRMVASMTQEFRMFVQMASAYDMLPDGTQPANSSSVAVTADPQLATEMHRSALAGVYMQMIEAGAKVPGSFSVPEAGKRFCETMRLPNPEKLLGQAPQPQATPKEKLDGAVALMKQKTENIKVTGQVAVQLTQALLNMVEASGGMLNNQAALLTMAQLEHAVKQMMQDAGNAGTSFDGMAQQSGDANAAALPAPPQSAGPIGVSGGTSSGTDITGAGSSLQ